MKKKEAIRAGVGGGVLFGVVQTFTMGVAGGIFMGLFFGVGMGVLLYKFANSKTINDQTSLEEAVLLPGERILLTKQANLVVNPEDFGLENFAFDDLLWAVGMKNRESLGGAMHLTNYRILFKTHRYNRLRGMISIFLPTIQQLENRTVLIFRKLAVTTVTGKVELVVSDVDDVISQIASARDQIDAPTLATLQNHATNHPEKCSEGLESWDALNKLNNLFNLGKKTTGVARAMVNPLGALGSIFLSELLDKTLAEKWQQVFHDTERNKATEDSKRPAA